MKKLWLFTSILMPLMVVSGLIGCAQSTPVEPTEPEDIELSLTTFSLGLAKFQVEGNICGTVVFGYDNQCGTLTAIEIRSDGIVWSYTFSKIGPPYTITTVSKLANGNYLVPISQIGIFEITRDGRIIWEYLSKEVLHTVEETYDGNIVVSWCIDNKVYEIDRSGKIVWEWKADDFILPYTEETYVNPQSPYIYYNMYEGLRRVPPEEYGFGEGHYEGWWTHLNYIQKLRNGNYLLCSRSWDMVFEVNTEGKVVWTFGPHVVKQPHCSVRLENGNTLIFDNGNGRVIEVTRSHEIVWEYTGLSSYRGGSCQRLPNGNTLIVDSEAKPPVILCVNPEGRTIWKVTVLEGIRSERGGFLRAIWYPN